MSQPKVERILKLMKLMASSIYYTIPELAEKIGVSERAIYRYIVSFKNAGLYVSKFHGNIYKIVNFDEDEGIELDKLLYITEEEGAILRHLLDMLENRNHAAASLRDKLCKIFHDIPVIEYTDRKDTALNYENLQEAISEKRKVILKKYRSGNSGSICDRHVEPYSFTANRDAVWAYDLKDGKNKTFTVERIGEVKNTYRQWTEEHLHQMEVTDIFRMSGDRNRHITLELTLRAMNLLTEEYPLASKYVKHRKGKWILDCDVRDYAGVCRFYLGLCSEIRIMDSPEFLEYVRAHIRSTLIPLLDTES